MADSSDKTTAINPQLTDWTGPLGLPRFDLIRDADFAPAFDATLAEAERAVEMIAANPEPASFDNTIAALELAEEPLNKVAAVFYTLASADANPDRQALERDLAPRMAAHNTRIVMDPRLFARIQAVSDAPDALNPEQARVTELYLRDFRRAGAALTGPKRDRMAAIRERLAVLSNQFSQNVLADERDYVLPLTEADLDGLPQSLRDMMAAAARERGIKGYALTLGRSLIVPFLEYSARRDLREIAWRAWTGRGDGTGAGGDATDNRRIAAEILQLRHERAQLLGYADFAAFKLEPEMAGSADRVRDLLMQVWGPARARAEADAARLTEMLHADGVNGVLEPWDWRFYARQRRGAEHAIDPEEVKPYLTLDAMLGAVFDVAGRLYGLSFVPVAAPLWRPEVRAWDVLRGDRHMATFVGDYFARPSKRSGAWCSSLQVQRLMAPDQRAIVTNICNFTPPSQPGAPAFLSWDDARTLFHEFGHATHHILSNVTYPSISGTSVARDFVELPSQLYEHWLSVPEILAKHARHAQTGEPMPDALRERLLAAANADAGFSTVEYLASALVDLDFHDGPPPADPMARQAEVLAELDLPHAIPMRHATPHFAHVFSGDGYSSGYYSYMWSELMDADAFAAFEEAGDPFDPPTARRLEETILSQGGSEPADQLWTRFRGRMPGVEPLLKGRGLTAG
ncbi:M3 family metallopeptidase [Paracoccus pacificus]|uniref:M3 family metallopeptidase n=1 Tax=Paracoccus pacificus TaxID=1463598 RepID=A0ABW4RAL7_9RHOB